MRTQLEAKKSFQRQRSNYLDKSSNSSNNNNNNNNGNNDNNENDNSNNDQQEQQQDTIRVRIWRALASGEEMSLSELAAKVDGGRRPKTVSELQSHLVHVEKQAKTIRNKSNAWRERRGLVPIIGNNNNKNDDDNNNVGGGVGSNNRTTKKKMRLVMKRRKKGKRNEVYVKMDGVR